RRTARRSPRSLTTRRSDFTSASWGSVPRTSTNADLLYRQLRRFVEGLWQLDGFGGESRVLGSHPVVVPQVLSAPPLRDVGGAEAGTQLAEASPQVVEPEILVVKEPDLSTRGHCDAADHMVSMAAWGELHLVDRQRREDRPLVHHDEARPFPQLVTQTDVGPREVRRDHLEPDHRHQRDPGVQTELQVSPKVGMVEVLVDVAEHDPIGLVPALFPDLVVEVLRRPD